MTPARWQQVKETLASALELETRTRRADFIARACADDDALREEVEALLQHSPDAFESWADEGGFLCSDSSAANDRGRRIGAYELLRELGRGGMGAVWLARRADKRFEQQVAIKLLKRGTDTEEVLRRFQSERQILASLEHPNIARLIDAGETDDGLPFFVMEFVEGIPLTNFAVEQHLSLPARLQLFCKICAAVQFAHQNLIVHRDLKPPNILVTGDGEPKLLDFGIAKLLASEAEAWAATIRGHERLTPAYASPEQVLGDPITTVSDVYSLGALLYEILCDRPPHSFAKERPSPTELMRVICQEAPTRPSLAAATPEMRRALRGDLETIILRAMSKEPARRYAGAGALADDLRRYEEGWPVRARRDTVRYRLAKFARRNKLAVAVAFLVVGGSFATAWEARLAKHEETLANERFRELRKVATSFLFELDSAIETRPTAARQLLVQRAREYLDSLAAEAADDASLQGELATAYQKLGDVESQLHQANIGDTAGALASYRKALQLRESLFAAAPQSNDLTPRLALAESYGRVADMLAKTGNTAGALENYRKALPLLEGAATSRETRIALASSHEIIGRTLFRTGDFPAAVVQYERALAMIEPLTHGADSDPAALLEQIKARGSLAYLDAEAGRKEQALEYYRQNLATASRLAAADPQNLTLQRWLMEGHEWVGTGLRDYGQLNEALLEYDQARELCARALAADSANAQTRNDLADVFHNIGITRYRQNDPRGALRDYEKAKDLYESVAAADPLNVHAQRQVWVAQQEIGEALALSGELPGALPKLRDTLAGFQRLARQDANNTEFQADEARAEAALGDVLLANGELGEAVAHLQKAAPIFEALIARAPMSVDLHRELEHVQSALAQLRQTSQRRDAKLQQDTASMTANCGTGAFLCAPR